MNKKGMMNGTGFGFEGKEQVWERWWFGFKRWRWMNKWVSDLLFWETTQQQPTTRDEELGFTTKLKHIYYGPDGLQFYLGWTQLICVHVCMGGRKRISMGWFTPPETDQAYPPQTNSFEPLKPNQPLNPTRNPSVHTVRPVSVGFHYFVQRYHQEPWLTPDLIDQLHVSL